MLTGQGFSVGGLLYLLWECIDGLHEFVQVRLSCNLNMGAVEDEVDKCFRQTKA